MHIIFTPFPFLSFFVSQENMAADHMCFVLLAWLSSLEVVSHTVRRELEVSLSTRACLGEAPPGCCRVCGGTPLCDGLFVAVGPEVCYIEPVV